MRVAIIYDDQVRRETTGVYCRRALGELVEVEHFTPADVGRIDAGRFDLFLNVDDGLRYVLPGRLRPSAYWAIDTHVDLAWAVEKSRTFDWVFAAQKDGAEALEHAGVAKVEWLPLACDPAIHGRQDVPVVYDVAFVGNVFPGPREELLNVIRREFPQSFIGRAYFEEMARVYSQARIAFNRSVANDVNMRVFEAMASGALLLTNDLSENGLPELFRPGIEIVTYRDAAEMVERIRYFLEHEDQRREIGEAGRITVVERHTYRRRMERVLEVCEERSGKVGEWQCEEVAEGQTGGGIEGQRDRGGECEAAAQGQRRKLRAESLHLDPSYFDHARPEVAELVPREARRILDVGCGAGRLGELLKTRQGAHVTGIEMNARAAEAARSRVDQVIVGDVESAELAVGEGAFDCVVCADVLEHLREPERLVSRIGKWLAPGGSLVGSVPNARHHSVIGGLLEGNWTYQAAGLLDRTHVRFFTRREIEKLFYRAGFEISDWQVVPGPGYEDWDRAGRPGSVRVGKLAIEGLPPSEAEEFFAYQYLVKATHVKRDWPLTSIVLVTHNAWAYTRECLSSIRMRTDEPYELIVVDNGSTDGTPEFLERMEDVRLIKNGENRGFPTAANQGIRAARGDVVVLLNNDTLVTTGWLRRMLEALERNRQAGLVGPCSNCVSGEQQVHVSYADLDALDGFAWQFGKARHGLTTRTDRLVGFCLGMRREVIDRVGLLDERFGLGNFEDDDYCRRAMAVGFECVIAGDAFVHHFGSRSFAENGVDLARVLQRNRQLFDEKWSQIPQPENPPEGADGTDHGAAEENANSLVADEERRFTLKRGPGGGLLLVSKGRSDQPLASLCMIVRNNEGTIGPCLESIRPWVDEMIVVDTGSTDRTLEICRELGAKVFHFPWCDSFSAARNESLRHASGKWLFWMDSDDTIPEASARGLRQLLLTGHPANVMGFVMKVHCPAPGPDKQLETTEVDHVKVFLNRPDLRFEFRIHEQIIPAIRRAGGEVVMTDLYVVHSGADHTPEGRERKLQRDLKLLQLDLAENAEHPFVLFNLGMTYADAARHQEAVDVLTRSIRASDPGDSQVRKVYAILVSSLHQLGKVTEAEQAASEGLSYYPRDPELWFRRGMVLHELGRPEESVEAYRRALANDDEPHFSSIHRGIVGYTARHNLAVVLSEMGRGEEALEEWQKVIGEEPGFANAYWGIGKVLFERGTPGQATDALRRLVALCPSDASAHHNLGMALLAAGDPRAAVSSLSESTRLNPEAAVVRRQLRDTITAVEQHVSPEPGEASKAAWWERAGGMAPWRE
jgi:GT2 family glycosyltransferase/2-polyprenyl-3-methyl-5-hydroxy-6-metoxy-1,4-benzoquinol methylase/tetratricopeptide (TPR) repeat protein